MTIIGLTGYAGSGKDTAAQCLIDRGWRRVAFADALKQLAHRLNPIITTEPRYTYRMLVAEHGLDEAKRTYLGIRSYLQELGVAVRDTFGEYAWVHVALNKIAEIGADENIVITDVRFINEASIIKSLGGSVVRVVRPNFRSLNDHVSETELDNIEEDYTITNDGTIQGLHHQVLGIVRTMQGSKDDCANREEAPVRPTGGLRDCRTVT